MTRAASLSHAVISHRVVAAILLTPAITEVDVVEVAVDFAMNRRSMAVQPACNFRHRDLRFEQSGDHPALRQIQVRVVASHRQSSRDPETRGSVTSTLQKGVISILRVHPITAEEFLC